MAGFIELIFVILCVANAVMLRILIKTKDHERKWIVFEPFLKFFKFNTHKPNALRIFFHLNLMVCNEIRLHFVVLGYGFDVGFKWYDVVKAVTNTKKEMSKEQTKNKIVLASTRTCHMVG